MKYTLKRTDGKSIEIEVPKKLSEVSLNSTIAFKTVNSYYIKWINRSIDDKTLSEDRNYILFLAARALSEFFKVDFVDFVNIDVSKLVDSEGQLLPQVLQKHLDLYDTEKESDLDSLENTLLGLYHLVLKLINSYEFKYKNHKNFEFSWKGKKYEIPHIVKVLFDGRNTFSKFSVNQTVEILELKKQLKGSFPESKIEYETIEDFMNVNFTAFMKIIALTVLEKGKSFPIDDIENYVNDNILLFQDIDTQLGYDIGFFLITTILKTSKTTQT